MKDFDTWNTSKKSIETNRKNKFYRERDIWWCSIGLNIGFEQDGKDKDFQRPILIVKGLSRETCLVAPLTTSPHEHKYRIPLKDIHGKDAKAIISQMRVIDTKRLINKIDVLDKETFRTIQKSIKDLL